MPDNIIPLPQVPAILNDRGLSVTYRKVHGAVVDGKIKAERHGGRIGMTTDQIEAAVTHFASQISSIN